MRERSRPAKLVGRSPSRSGKKAAEEAKAAEQKEKEEEAQEEAAIAGAKKELNRLFTLLSEKRLDLEDAERNYSREIAR